jgi:hypothetical protein
MIFPSKLPLLEAERMLTAIDEKASCPKRLRCPRIFRWPQNTLASALRQAFMTARIILI